MKKTFEELTEVDQIIGQLYAKKPDLKNTKFGYAYDKFYKLNIKPVADRMRDEILDVRVENAMEDKTTKQILADKTSFRGFLYTKAGLRDVIKAEREIEERYSNEEVEVQPYFSSYIPEELEDYQKELLLGLIIK